MSYLSRWFAQTYNAQGDLGTYFAFFSIIGMPLALGSVMHLYPHVFLNLLGLGLCMAWSMYLLYVGVPIALKTGRERGMLMASAIVGYLLVTCVSLLGLTTILWTHGIGPKLGI